ncbi:leukocyte elastase inhibitor-like [Planococcus citri]|uniref:leukocyte elastase inhibitor-like n=1 Tax=Planococcus citri TaxID=170843 RepID=UPI0031F9AE10
MMLLPALLICIAANICVFAQTNPKETEFSRNVQKSVNKMNLDFAKILLENLPSEGNFIFSPLNIYGALALVHLGATGTTRNELSNALGLPAEENKLAEAHEKLGKLLIDIQIRQSAKVNIANQIFTSKGLKLKDGYTKGTVNYYYISQAQRVDFAKSGPEATNIVNKWVADETYQRIPKLFSDEISKDTIILLASVLYFAGKWSDTFHEIHTQTKNFHTGLKQIPVPTMSKNESVPYVSNKDLKFEAISIPYVYGEFSMLIILPNRNQSVKTLVNSLKSEQISEVIKSLELTYVNYQIPRMKFRWSQDIKEALVKLGVKQMFSSAELGNMVDLNNTRVSKVTHAAEIEVHEKGTAASAATTIQRRLMMGKFYSYTSPPIPFYVDRPFLFSIYHRDTGIILLTGTVQNPTVYRSADELCFKKHDLYV